MKVLVLKKSIKIKDKFFGKNIEVVIPYKKENFENKGWCHIEDIDRHLEYISSNFQAIYNSVPNIIFKSSLVLEGELLIVDKDSSLFKCFYYELDSKKFKTHFKISTEGKIITDIDFV